MFVIPELLLPCVYRPREGGEREEVKQMYLFLFYFFNGIKMCIVIQPFFIYYIMNIFLCQCIHISIILKYRMEVLLN